MSTWTEEPSAHLVAKWRDGDQRAAEELFRRYANRLAALARSRLPGRLRRRVDADDVVQSVYRCFFANARDDRYELQRGGDLWRLLVAITLDKLHDQVRRNLRAKRSLKREQDFRGDDSLFGMHRETLARTPSPLEATALAEVIEQAMDRLEPRERRMLELRLLGFSLEEIAADTKRSQSTVIRVLNEIRRQLEQVLSSAP
jgi:RNA polymerase sigma-70 factor (ECF subfamily)